MAGIMNKIGDALNMGGGNKEEDKNKHPEVHKAQQHEENKGGFMDKIKGKIPGGEKEHKPQQHEENKGGFMDKIKGKIPGGEKDTEGKKKKKEKKKKGEHGDSSSSDSD